MHSLGRLVAVAIGAALLTVLGTSSTLAGESKTLTGVKQCTGIVPGSPATNTCLVTESSLKILRGATFHYTDVVFLPTPPSTTADHFTSPIWLTAIDKRASTATGRCTFYFAGPKASTGHCEFWNGTDKLDGFHALITVGTISKALKEYSLAGTYWFDHDNEDGTGS